MPKLSELLLPGDMELFKKISALVPSEDNDSIQSVAYGLSKIIVSDEHDGANIIMAIQMLLEYEELLSQ